MNWGYTERYIGQLKRGTKSATLRTPRRHRRSLFHQTFLDFQSCGAATDVQSKAGEPLLISQEFFRQVSAIVRAAERRQRNEKRSP
jgi:hypothetical protein